MRIAVSIIAGGLTLVIALQSCTAQVGGGVSRNAPLRAAGDAGWLIALLYLLGAGFAYGVPALAAIVFGLTGVISLGIGANTGVGAFGFWGLLALTLATMSLAGWREKRRAFRRRVVHRAIDEELVPVDTGPLPCPGRLPVCPRCRATAVSGARFCDRCGSALTAPPEA